VGHALGFISTLDKPEMFGVNPEFAHETMSGLSFYHAVSQALWQGKLFHIDLNGQKIGRYDQDLRFGSEGIKDDFFLVKLLEESGYSGARHFDAHPYRNENPEGVWDFAPAACAHTWRSRRRLVVSPPTRRSRPLSRRHRSRNWPSQRRQVLGGRCCGTPVHRRRPGRSGRSRLLQ